jgi:Ribbon-helix-helix domain
MDGEPIPVARWNLVIPDKTDRAVRTYLARTGGRKGDLSRFVDEAVRRRVLDLTVREIKDRNARYHQQEIIDLIDEEVAAARADRP